MNLFVSNLNPETTVAKLRPLFAQFGEVVSAKVIIDNATGMSRGFGFVEMADKFMAFDCIDNIDSTFFDGNVISVKEAKPANSKPSSGPNRNFNANRSAGSGSSYGGNRPYNKPGGPRPGGPSQRPGGPRPQRPPRPGGYNSGNYNSQPGFDNNKY